MLKRGKSSKKSMPVLVMVALLFMLSLVSGCSKGDKEDVVIPDISLNKSELALEKGKTERLIASFSPAETPDKGHVWSSSAPDIALVDETGVVTAVEPGEAIITATALMGKKKATCKVTVVEKTISVTGISINPTEATMVVGDDLALEVAVIPDNATNKAVKWSSGDSKIASVDDAGKVIAIAEGKTIIKAITVDGDKTTFCQIMVVDKGVKISKPEISGITSISAVVTGTVKAMGAKLEEVGICYSTFQSPTVEDKKIVLSGDDLSCTLTKLEESTTYYVRIYAKSDGTYYYGEQGEFATTGVIKTHFVATDIYEDKILLTSAAPSGITQIDICYGTSPNPSITDNVTTASTVNGKLHLTLSGLKSATTYYIRAYSLKGSNVEYYGDEASVQTLGGEFKITHKYTSYSTTEETYPVHMTLYTLFFDMTYDIRPKGTYKVEMIGGGYLKKTADYISSMYLENGSGTFYFKKDNGKLEYSGANTYIYFSSETDIRFTNIDNNICYHHIVRASDWYIF